MDFEHFEHFTDRTNMAGIVLQVHFLALEMAMRPWLKVGRLAFHQSDNNVMLNTLGSFVGSGLVDDAARFERLVRWPKAFLESGGESLGTCDRLVEPASSAVRVSWLTS